MAYDEATRAKPRPGQQKPPQPPPYRQPEPKKPWHWSWSQRDWPPLVGAFCNRIFREMCIAAMCIVFGAVIGFAGNLIVAIGPEGTVSFAALVDMLDPQAAGSPGALHTILNLIGSDFRHYLLPGAATGLAIYGFMTLVRNKR